MILGNPVRISSLSSDSCDSEVLDPSDDRVVGCGPHPQTLSLETLQAGEARTTDVPVR